MFSLRAWSADLHAGGLTVGDAALKYPRQIEDVRMPR